MMRFAFMGYRATNRLPLEEVAAVKAPDRIIVHPRPYSRHVEVCAVLLAREKSVVYTAITQGITRKYQPTILHAALDALFFSKKA